MDGIKDFFNYVLSFERKNAISIDLCHNVLLFGAILSSKPNKVLELGIGNGYSTKCILAALKYNQMGALTSVDNFYDWKGRKPDHVDELQAMGANIIVEAERAFVHNAESNTYDFIMSDADHDHAGEWVDQIVRIAKNDAIIFVHDVFYTPSVNKYLQYCQHNNIPHFVFNKSSLLNESCHNGLLMFRNKK